MDDSEEFSLVKASHCDYTEEFKCCGNEVVDTIKVGERLVDPIDDFNSFDETDFGFFEKDNRIYKKSKTHRDCFGEFVTVEYFQDFTDRIELSSYKEYDDVYFTSKGEVYFWWVNSGGHLICPINKADPATFKPFDDICGGKDKDGVYYGCPNFGVYKLNILVNSKFEFVPKKNNYWNSPSHWVIVDNRVYNVKYELGKGYFCELDKTISLDEVKKMKS